MKPFTPIDGFNRFLLTTVGGNRRQVILATRNVGLN